MTAIFTFVGGDVAFVASDTKREVHGYATVAPKAVRWSENIVIPQTGFGEGLKRLIGELMSWQHRHPSMLTSVGIAHAFGQVADARLQAEIDRLARQANADKVDGTLIVTEASRSGSAAQIMTLDWRSKAVTPQPAPVYADGTAQPDFLAIAKTEFAARNVGAGSFDLAAWGMACIEKAQASSAGAAVNWPVDLTICRTDGGLPISLTQRVGSPSAPTHPLFVI
ncbi:hypothetical protein [Sphingomonas xinjiangensis]|uniref:Uncharacterized protein n=1 Tax=Sphingomonas xinjiangensis TaxID=643568 RepID=A0A840YC07_9SPHN|nr:hypothetical protein [Sphingomonas xinjiangensis]MBB5710887.1 hypothetical protein [Sphingomonas xinjiangensis]